MPFSEPFRKIFHQDDLVYGLNSSRNQYVINGTVDAFAEAKSQFYNNNHQPVIIDDYITPADKKNMIHFLSDYNSKKNWENKEEKEYNDNILSNFLRQREKSH